MKLLLRLLRSQYLFFKRNVYSLSLSRWLSKHQVNDTEFLSVHLMSIYSLAGILRDVAGGGGVQVRYWFRSTFISVSFKWEERVKVCTVRLPRDECKVVGRPVRKGAQSAFIILKETIQSWPVSNLQSFSYDKNTLCIEATKTDEISNRMSHLPRFPPYLRETSNIWDNRESTWNLGYKYTNFASGMITICIWGKIFF